MSLYVFLTTSFPAGFLPKTDRFDDVVRGRETAVTAGKTQAGFQLGNTSFEADDGLFLIFNYSKKSFNGILKGFNIGRWWHERSVGFTKRYREKSKQRRCRH